jgi:hypothetical protein
MWPLLTHPCVLLSNLVSLHCVIHGYDCSNWGLKCSDIVWSCWWIPVFQRNMLRPSSGSGLKRVGWWFGYKGEVPRKVVTQSLCREWRNRAWANGRMGNSGPLQGPNIIYIFRSWDSSANMAMGYMLYGRGSICGRNKIFLFSIVFRLALGHT